jgi:hypothetical protein
MISPCFISLRFGKQSTRSNSNKNENEEEEEFRRCMDELHDEDQPEIKLEIGEYMGGDGKTSIQHTLIFIAVKQCYIFVF